MIATSYASSSSIMNALPSSMSRENLLAKIRDLEAGHASLEEELFRLKHPEQHLNRAHSQSVPSWKKALSPPRKKELSPVHVHADGLTGVQYLNILNSMGQAVHILNGPHCRVIYWFMYERGTSQGVTNVAYLCPEKLSSVDRYPDGVEKYIISALHGQQDKKYVHIIGAYFELQHWMLIVICPEKSVVYWFDSKQNDRRISLKPHLNMAFRVYCQQGGRHDVKKRTSLMWPRTECPQQPKSYECAYYAMKFMYDIVLTHSAKDDLSKVYGVHSLSMGDIKEVRDLWSTYFMEHCI